jgi:type II secretory pathway pseudopilin PulG
MKHLKKAVQYSTGRGLDNQGSTLLTVIICIAFISILGSLILSVTMTNLQMKLIESKSKKNFYSCETIMEKIRTAAQEAAAESVKYVYVNDVLKNYASYLPKNEDERNTINTIIQQKVIARFMVTVGGADPATAYDAVASQAALTGYQITNPTDPDKNNYFKTSMY